LIFRLRGTIIEKRKTTHSGRPLMTIKRPAALAAIMMILGLGAFGQFTPQEIAERPTIERFLASAAIVSAQPIGEGVTRPIKVFLKQGEIEHQGVWKNVTGRPLGIPDEWRYEIAAYRMDKLLDLGMVPPTVERVLWRRKGSLQFWAKTARSLLDVAEKKIQIPPSYAEPMTRNKYLVRAFDSLIANEDRTQQNVRYTEDWRTILIDHSRSFRSSKASFESLLFGRNGTQKGDDGRAFPIKSLPRRFFERLKALTFESIEAATAGTLDEKEIRAVLARRDLLVKDAEASIAETGESEFLYD
jgi:hypothetical protein